MLHYRAQWIPMTTDRIWSPSASRMASISGSTARRLLSYLGFGADFPRWDTLRCLGFSFGGKLHLEFWLTVCLGEWRGIPWSAEYTHWPSGQARFEWANLMDFIFEWRLFNYHSSVGLKEFSLSQYVACDHAWPVPAHTLNNTKEDIRQHMRQNKRNSISNLKRSYWTWKTQIEHATNNLYIYQFICAYIYIYR